MKTCRRGSARKKFGKEEAPEEEVQEEDVQEEKCSEEEVLEKEGLLVHQGSFCSSGKSMSPSTDTGQKQQAPMMGPLPSLC